MRIWSLHPCYLDTKGLVALWRETLLARHVLDGKTRGYKNHPQLQRFRELPDPLSAIDQYLSEVYTEAVHRGYNFNRNKINWDFKPVRVKVTSGQMTFEANHLLNKLAARDPDKYRVLQTAATPPSPHPLFEIIPGDIEPWEII